jgi:hypothetical protein
VSALSWVRRLAAALAIASGCASAPPPTPDAPPVAWDPARWDDARFQSAWLLREQGLDAVGPPVEQQAEVARLRRHFAAVDELLAADAPTSLDVALARLEASRGGFDAADRSAWRERLARARAQQVERLRGARPLPAQRARHGLGPALRRRARHGVRRRLSDARVGGSAGSAARDRSRTPRCPSGSRST